MKCSNCQAEFENETRHCPNCGHYEAAKTPVPLGRMLLSVFLGVLGALFALFGTCSVLFTMSLPFMIIPGVIALGIAWLLVRASSETWTGRK